MNAIGKTVDPVWGASDVTSRKGADDENFPVGSFLFAKENRAHVIAYYNFARVIDDMVDNATLSSEAKIARLRGMEEVVRGEREAPQRADAQSAVILRRHLLQTGVPVETATDLITAFCRMRSRPGMTAGMSFWGIAAFRQTLSGVFCCCYMARRPRHYRFLTHFAARCRFSIIFRM